MTGGGAIGCDCCRGCGSGRICERRQDERHRRCACGIFPGIGNCGPQITGERTDYNQHQHDGDSHQTRRKGGQEAWLHDINRERHPAHDLVHRYINPSRITLARLQFVGIDPDHKLDGKRFIGVKPLPRRYAEPRRLFVIIDCKFLRLTASVTHLEDEALLHALLYRAKV